MVCEFSLLILIKRKNTLQYTLLVPQSSKQVADIHCVCSLAICASVLQQYVMLGKVNHTVRKHLDTICNRTSLQIFYVYLAKFDVCLQVVRHQVMYELQQHCSAVGDLPAQGVQVHGWINISFLLYVWVGILKLVLQIRSKGQCKCFKTEAHAHHESFHVCTSPVLAAAVCTVQQAAVQSLPLCLHLSFCCCFPQICSQNKVFPFIVSASLDEWSISQCQAHFFLDRQCLIKQE